MLLEILHCGDRKHKGLDANLPRLGFKRNVIPRKDKDEEYHSDRHAPLLGTMPEWAT
jgi:hypothetical protein